MKLSSLFQSLIVTLLVAACAHETTIEPYHSNEQPFPLYLSSQKKIGCEALVDDYCSFLYSPEALGNIQLKRSKESIQIRQGYTPNDLSQVFYFYSKTKIKNQHLLPKDFRLALENADYFSKLNRFLARRAISTQSLNERLESNKLQSELGAIWSYSIQNTLTRRMTKKYSAFHQIPERNLPPEFELERQKQKRFLISEISEALWRNDRNWLRVTDSFQKLKQIFLTLIEHLDADATLRTDWSQRISDLKLILPGSIPEISDEECSTTTINAFYFQNMNVITICAGDFNSEDILLTLGHEMAHALDISENIFLHKQRSELGQAEKRLQINVCSSKEPSCEEWSEFKSKLEQRLDALESFSAGLKTFNQCLKIKKTTDTPSTKDLDRIAKSITYDRFSHFANRDFFLRLIKKKIPLKNGRLEKNPYYMNPCNYYLSSIYEPLDSEVYSLIFFASEYRCADATLDASARLRASLQSAQAITQKVVKSVLKVENEFSGYEEMEKEGFASSSAERFADVLGSMATAEYLKRHKNLVDRRHKFLAGFSWQCEAPSLAQFYPEENSVEKEFANDVHSEGLFRTRELLTQPMREVLSCEKDFEFDECQIPLKK